MRAETLSAADLERRTRLRRAKAFATGLLAFAAVVFLIVRPIAADGVVWAGYVEAAAEAAMIGALADWFAVTALFRRPLGLPIPHTALIPTRKDALGSSLQSFVSENFLSAAVVRERLAQVGVTERIGAWLGDPENARIVANETATVVRGAIEVLSDDDIREVAESAIGTRLRDAEVGPVLGRLLGQIVEDGSHHQLVDVVADRSSEWLRLHEDAVLRVVQRQAPPWSPEFVDRALARKLHAELVRIADDVAADPRHPVRLALDDYLASLSRDLREDPDTDQRVREVAERLMRHDATREALGSLVGSTRLAVLKLVDEPNSALRLTTAEAIGALGRKLQYDPEMRDKVDGWAASVVEHVVVTYPDQITSVIRDTVELWDGEETARRIELVAGRDLQFIRVNGTIVGALAGLAIHSVALALG